MKTEPKKRRFDASLATSVVLAAALGLTGGVAYRAYEVDAAGNAANATTAAANPAASAATAPDAAPYANPDAYGDDAFTSPYSSPSDENGGATLAPQATAPDARAWPVQPRVRGRGFGFGGATGTTRGS